MKKSVAGQCRVGEIMRMRTLDLVKLILVGIYCLGVVIVFVPTGMKPVSMTSPEKKPKAGNQVKPHKADPKISQQMWGGIKRLFV